MTTLAAKATLTISSPVFEHESYIPMNYTVKVRNINVNKAICPGQKMIFRTP
jgi:hypothetical protein